MTRDSVSQCFGTNKRHSETNFLLLWHIQLHFKQVQMQIFIWDTMGVCAEIYVCVLDGKSAS